MTLQFVLGKASVDHQQKMIELLKQKQTEHLNDTFFYIVPNHIKFESEVQIIKGLDEKHTGLTAQSKVQVFSFSRLSWYFLRDTPQYQKQRISKAGVNMLLYQIINEQQSQLFLFDQEVEHPGFLDKLAQQINEVQLGNVSPNDLFEIMENPEISADLSDKLHDFNIVYQAYVDKMSAHFFDNANGTQLLNDYLINADLSHFHFFIDGFSGLVAQENQLLNTIIQKANSTTVSLILDREYRTELPKKFNLFYQPAKMFNRLYKFASLNKIPYLPVINADKVRVDQELTDLESYWMDSTNLGTITAFNDKILQNITVMRTDNTYSEILQVTTKIHQLVADGKYRYNDILILTRDLSKYQNVLDTIFNMQEIPYFLDLQKQMGDHPLVELLAALFEIDGPNLTHRSYRYQDMMRLLKSELLIPQIDGHLMDINEYRQSVNLIDNAILKNGYLKHQWLQEKDWQTIPVPIEKSDKVAAVEQQINQIRQFVKDTLPKFYENLFGSATYQAAASCLYQFLKDSRILDRLKIWQQAALKADDLNTTDQIEQVWNTFCQILDELVLILGNQPFNANLFWPLIKAGFEGADYAQIPSTLDQVAISESGMIQANSHKVTFIIGATNDQMPLTKASEHLFDDNDKNQIITQLMEDKYLSDSAQLQMANEPYLSYLTFMSGSEKLIFTYSIDTSEDNVIKVSPYVERIKAHFKLVEQHAPAIPEGNNSIMSYLGTKRTGLHHLIQVIQNAYQNKTELSSTWQYLYQKLTADANYRELVEHLLSSINYRNVPVTLNPEIVTDLYSSDLNVSISQLEAFYKNPYEYFLNYGLRLRERQEFDLNPQIKGNYFHDALDEIIKSVHSKGIDLVNMDESMITKLVNDTLDNLINDDRKQYYILQSSNRMKYLAEKLNQTVHQMVDIIRQQEKRTLMRPVKTEKSFGFPDSDNLKGLRYQLATGNQINVRGRIDRIDSMIDQETGIEYFEVIDYKSREKTFDEVKAFDGISIQLLTYLQVIQNNLDVLTDREARLAGALYLHIQNAKLNLADVKGLETLAQEFLKNNKYTGFVIDDGSLLQQLDSSIDAGDASSVYPFKINKNGIIAKKETTINIEKTNTLIEHNEELIIDAGNRIMQGDIALTPYQEKNGENAVTDSSYKAIMNFDSMLPENNYRKATDQNELKIITDLQGNPLSKEK